MLTLAKTKYLPSLKGKRWRDEDGNVSFTNDQQRYIKRAKLKINIIQRESHESAKYELFQRPNTGGASLSGQEVRSCVLISVNRAYYKWISDLSKTESFQQCLPITDRQRSEQYDLELALRFVTLRSLNVVDIAGFRELGEYITDQSIIQASNESFNYSHESQIFIKTFECLHAALEDDIFRRHTPSRDRFAGGFLISAFEVIALGVGYNIATFDNAPSKIGEKVKRKCG